MQAYTSIQGKLTEKGRVPCPTKPVCISIPEWPFDKIKNNQSLFVTILTCCCDVKGV